MTETDINTNCPVPIDGVGDLSPSHDFLNLPPLRSPRKVKPKRIIVPGKYDLRKLYYDARRVMFEREYPAAWKAGEYYDNKFHDVLTTNGTQNYIQDVLNNMGHQAERVNTMGIPTKTGWRRSGSTKGSPDIHCNIKIPSQAFPVSWKIEVKKGNDDLNKSQEKYKAKADKIGILHTVLHVGNLDLFWDEYYKIMAL